MNAHLASKAKKEIIILIATHIMAFEGDSRVCWFEGNYSEYETDRRLRLGHQADRSHRIHYRKLKLG